LSVAASSRDIVPPPGAGVEPRFIRAFRAFGLPRAIRTDNSPPFASAGAAGIAHHGEGVGGAPTYP